MFFKQIVREDLGCASYVLGSQGLCAIVDPRWDAVEEYLETARRYGLRITHILETHVHADHVSGNRGLAKRTGASIYLSATARVEFDHISLQDGEQIELGDLLITTLSTPGHSPDSVCFLVADRTRAEEPWLVLTGDTLFIGDVGRPDLHGAGGAASLYDSLFGRLLKLDDGVEIYPAHVSGSLCGRMMNAKSLSTIGFERRFNHALRPRTKEEFVQFLEADLPPRPLSFAEIVRVNRQGPPTGELAAEPLPIGRVKALLAEGVKILDVRPPASFREGHLAGSITVNCEAPQFGNRVGFVVEPGTPLILVAESDQQARAAIQSLGATGYYGILGYVVATPSAWARAGLAIARLPELDLAALRDLIASGTAPQIVDVREPSEWADGIISGARTIPYRELPQRLAELDPSRPTAAICAGGVRSTIAASLLARAGFQSVYDVPAGMNGWCRAGYETTKDEGRRTKDG